MRSSWLQQQRQQAQAIYESIAQGLVAHGTHVNENEKDPYGDGDQSEIRKAAHQQFYRDLFSQGGDLAEWFSSGLASEFAVSCLQGNVAQVRQMLEKAAAAATTANSQYDHDDSLGTPSKALVELLERRETSMRLSPLLIIVSAGKNISDGSRDPSLSANQIKVA